MHKRFIKKFKKRLQDDKDEDKTSASGETPPTFSSPLEINHFNYQEALDQLLKSYKQAELGDLYPTAREIESECGYCIVIERDVDKTPFRLPEELSQEFFRRRLSLVKYIGVLLECKFKEKGVTCIDDLVNHPGGWKKPKRGNFSIFLEI